MLRPIDVIFKHPTKKFTVIYQNGLLWQLPRLEFDSQSLLHKKRYRGSREHIFVAKNQRLNPADIDLTNQLLTIDLPKSVIGRNVNEFEHWWQYNWFKFNDVIANQLKLQQNAAQTNVTNIHLQPQPSISLSNHQSTLWQTHQPDYIDQMLDNMLDDLMNDN